MVFLSSDRMNAGLLARFARRQFAPNRYDLIALALIGAAAVLVVHGAQQMNLPLASLHTEPGRASIRRACPNTRCAPRCACSRPSSPRCCSPSWSPPLAAKSRKAELVIVPALDILQSVPVLGFLTFTVTFFIGLFPTQRAGRGVRLDLRRLHRPGLEHGLQLLPVAAHPAAATWTRSAGSSACRPGGGSSGWSCPSPRPALVWNTMMSMSGGWFFVVASEAITVGKTTVTLPGIGSWLAVAIDHAGLRRRRPGRWAPWRW